MKDWLRSAPEKRLAVLPSLQHPLRMFHDICRGVEYVHAQGLIHRDLKPGNIFFSADHGTLKIGDFGLVTQVAPQGQEEEDDDDEDHAEESMKRASRLSIGQHTDQVGTELYMSPEQLARRAYDHKVDVYSLGLILFELLVPFSTQVGALTA